MSYISDWFSEVNFYDFHKVLLDERYFELIFPFLLLYAIFFTVLSTVKIFKNKAGKANKGVVVILSLIITFFSVNFELSSGYPIGRMISELFPQISAIGIGILGLYVVAGIMGKDFFFGMFSGKTSSFAVLILGVFGLGTVMFYLGIAMGFFDYDVLDSSAQWNFIVLIGTLITGAVLLVVGRSPGSQGVLPFGILLIFVDIVYIYNGAEGNILEYYIDPIVFIVVLITFIYSWTMSKEDQKKLLVTKIKESERSIEEFEAGMNPKYKDTYHNRIYDISKQSLDKNRKKLEELNKK